RRRHDPAVDAVAALRYLLFDIGGLQRMGLLRRAEAGERHHPAIADRRNRRHAGADRLTIELDRARAALRKAAAEMGIVQADVVATPIQERHVRMGIDRVVLAVDIEGEFLSHDVSFPRWRGMAE